MKSLKVKLVSIVSAFILALSLLIVGVWAVGQSQTITMEGSVNFNVADKSLYVQDVRMQEDVNSAPYSLKDQDKFMPGFINGNFDMNLGDFTNSYGSFALYFDIINTMDETTSETFAYTVDPPTQPSNGTATITILDTNGDTIDRIPQGTVKPSQISDSTQVSATIKLTIASTSSSQVDLSDITITINQFVPEVYAYFDFEVDEQTKTATLTSFNESLAEGKTDIVIPASISKNAEEQWIEGDTYTVTAIAGGRYNGVFYNSGITSIELPSTLTSIGNNAFNGCSGLTTVDLSNCTSLTSIGDNAFQNCSSLIGELNLGECTSLISIGMRAFDSCSGLTSITLPSSLTSIELAALNRCGGLESITVEEGNSVYHSEGNCMIETDTDTLVFGCNNSTIPSYITIIGAGAFLGCSGLTSITLPSGLTGMGESAFWDCSGLTTVDLSNCTSLTSIENGAFNGCSKLTSITLPEGLTDIGEVAFDGCSGLTTVNLSNCTSLTSIWYKAFNGCSKLTSISLPSSLTRIGDSAFSYCSGLTTVDLSNCTSLTRIEDSAFSYCSGLTTVDLSNCTSLKSIGTSAFSGCTNLNSVTFPNTTGWYVTQDTSATSGKEVDVSLPSTNASNLKGQYLDYYWKRNV